jgi:ElaB/YqjD/DUF883 family membrane-anchored ribosome-binding protein
MSHSIDCMLCRKTIHDPDAQGQLTLRSEGRTSYLCAACNEVRESPIRWGYIWCAVADELGRLRDEVERLKASCHAWAEDVREAGRLCEQAGNEMPIDAVRRFVSSKTAIVDMLQDRLGEARSEVDRLTDERDELLVRVANQDAELRATRETYRDAYRRGAEAMREACARWFSTSQVIWMEPDEYIETANDIRALPIPEEP